MKTKTDSVALAATIAAHPERLADVPREELPGLIRVFGGIAAEAEMRYAMRPAPTTEEGPPPTNGDDPSDKLLTADETAARLGVSRRWLYRKADTLPFLRRLGPNKVRYSESGLNDWLESLTPTGR